MDTILRAFGISRLTLELTLPNLVKYALTTQPLNMRLMLVYPFLSNIKIIVIIMVIIIIMQVQSSSATYYPRSISPEPQHRYRLKRQFIPDTAYVVPDGRISQRKHKRLITVDDIIVDDRARNSDDDLMTMTEETDFQFRRKPFRSLTPPPRRFSPKPFAAPAWKQYYFPQKDDRDVLLPLDQYLSQQSTTEQMSKTETDTKQDDFLGYADFMRERRCVFLSGVD